MMNDYLNKRLLIEKIMRSMYDNKHCSEIGSMVHEQEHRHLIKIVENCPTDKAMQVEEVQQLISQIFDELQSLMETIKYSDPEVGYWSETFTELDIDTLNELRNKYMDILTK